MLYLFLFHGNNGYTNAPQCYVYTYIASLVIEMYCGILNLNLSFLLWQMWSVDYVQVPKEDKLGISHGESEDNGEAAGPPSEMVVSSPTGRDTMTIKVSDTDSAQRVADLVKQMSLSAEFATNDSGMAIRY
jgi:hypothetical protein